MKLSLWSRSSRCVFHRQLLFILFVFLKYISCCSFVDSCFFSSRWLFLMSIIHQVFNLIFSLVSIATSMLTISNFHYNLFVFILSLFTFRRTFCACIPALFDIIGPSKKLIHIHQHQGFNFILGIQIHPLYRTMYLCSIGYVFINKFVCGRVTHAFLQ